MIDAKKLESLNISFQLDHMGIAVKSIEDAVKNYQLLGLTAVETEVVESEKVKVCMLPLKNQCQIELLEATDESSPIAKFIEKRGEGIHHICLRVENIENVIDNLKRDGIRLINEEPKQGAGGCKIAFIHPKAMGGVLIELSEKM